MVAFSVAVVSSPDHMLNTNLLLTAIRRGGGETQVSSDIQAQIAANGATGRQGWQHQGGAT